MNTRMRESEYCADVGSGSFFGIKPMVREKKQKRFSEEQIRLLETMFEAENKLEPRRKLQLSRELGLQPRQIAIWFQNRRARWKSKQLEREYSVLHANYEALVSRFESLKQEKQVLLKQLQKLRDLIEKPRGSESAEENRYCMFGTDQNSNDEDSGNGDAKSEYKEKPAVSPKAKPYLRAAAYSDREDSKNTGECEEQELLGMEDPVYGSLAFPEKLCTLDTDCYPDQFSSSLQWWELWS